MNEQKLIMKQPRELLTSQPWIPILVYHSICSDSALNAHSGYSLPVEKFGRQMQYLHEEGYQCLDMSTFLKIKYANGQPPGKGFVLTFDDGYEDFLTNAFPILERFKFTATVFLATNWVGGWNEWDGPDGKPLLRWEQIVSLRKAGIIFGSHTCSHPRLLSLSNKEIWFELTASRQDLENELGEEVKYLAYPYGESNIEIQALAEQAGYDAACGVITGRNGKYNLWRNSFGPQDSLRTFSFRLTSWNDRLLQIRRWVREDTGMRPYIQAIKRRN
jgi:peptidoglycan/xylan/chitin deacetylase (PgdA/CDA1 family)